jgi:hypothetical protein
MTSTPFFHEASGTVRAMISKEMLHYRDPPAAIDDRPMETFALHTEELHAAVCRRVICGAFVPVMPLLSPCRTDGT